MRHLTVVTLFALISISSPPVAAQQARWDPSWPEYGVTDALVTTGFGALAITSELIGGPRTPRWSREILLDLPLRRAIGSTQTVGEHRAATISDIGLGLMVAAPFADAGFVGYGVHRDTKLATNFGLVALQSFAVTAGVTNLTKVLVGRERPLVADCFERRAKDPAAQCETRPNVSFFSGHTSISFTGAGLICAFGTITPMHGEGAVGQIPCVGALTAAATIAVLRIVANKHHLSDVLVGATAGLLSGWLWPALRFPTD